MSETTTTENGKPKREQAAKHSFLLFDGSETRDIHLATGIRYQDVASGEVFEWQLPNLQLILAAVAVGRSADEAWALVSPLRMSGVFGSKTKATNEASQIRQQGDEAEISQVDSIIEVFDKIKAGVWREPSEGVGVAKVDRDSLALALVEAQKALGNDRDLNAVRARLDSDTKFFRGARKAEDVTAIYNKLVGKDSKPKTSADLF